MRSWLRCHRTVLVVMGAISALVLVGYAYQQAQMQEQVANECEKAFDATATTFMAIRDGDLRKLKTVVYTRSGDWIVLEKSPRRAPKIMASLSRTYDLKSLSDRQIRDSLEVVPNVPDRLTAGMALWSVTPDSWKRLVANPVDDIVVRCNLPKHALVVLCLKENGKWKVCALPAFSAKVLLYSSVDEASQHNDAIAE